MYEVRRNATLTKHLMTVMRERARESGVCEQESRGQARRSRDDVSFQHFGVKSVCVCVHDYMRQRVFASTGFRSL